MEADLRLSGHGGGSMGVMGRDHARDPETADTTHGSCRFRSLTSITVA